jgi:hypothetical protein
MAATLIGGEKLQVYLKGLASKLTSGEVRVGFLESAMYPVEDRTARFLAGLHKFEASKQGPAKPGTKPKESSPQQRLPLSGSPLPVAQVAFWNNFGTSRAPPRPFFSNMVKNDSPSWGKKLAAIAKEHEYNTAASLEAMGQYIKDRLQRAIVDWPADNAPLTIAIKGFNKGLIDRGTMQREVDFEVKS